MKKKINLLFAVLVLISASLFGQTTTVIQKFQLDKTYKADSIATTITNNVIKRDTLFPDTAAILALKCSTAVQPPVVTMERHAMYIDNTSARLGTADIPTIYLLMEVDSFNTFYCYNSALSGSKMSLQAEFNRQVHLRGGKVGDVSASSFTSTLNFNKAQTDPLCRFDILVFESCCPEFWNESSTALMTTHFIKDSTNVVAANKLIGQYGITEVIYYAGHLKSPLQSRFPTMLVNQTSQVELHMYTTDYNKEYVTYRVDSLNNIALRNKTVKSYTEIHSYEDVFFGRQLKTTNIHVIRAKRRALFNAHNYKGLKYDGDVNFDYKWYIKNRVPLQLASSPVASPAARMLNVKSFDDKHKFDVQMIDSTIYNSTKDLE